MTTIISTGQLSSASLSTITLIPSTLSTAREYTFYATISGSLAPVLTTLLTVPVITGSETLVATELKIPALTETDEASSIFTSYVTETIDALYTTAYLDRTTLPGPTATISTGASLSTILLGTTYFPSGTIYASGTTYFPSGTIYASGSAATQNAQQANPLLSRGALAAIIVGALVGASLICAAFLFLYCRRRRYRRSPSDHIETPPVREVNQPQSAKPGHRTSELPSAHNITKYHEMGTKTLESAELEGNYYDEDVNTFATSDEKKLIPGQRKSDQSVSIKTFGTEKIG